MYVYNFLTLIVYFLTFYSLCVYIMCVGLLFILWLPYGVINDNKQLFPRQYVPVSDYSRVLALWEIFKGHNINTC